MLIWACRSARVVHPRHFLLHNGALPCPSLCLVWKQHTGNYLICALSSFFSFQLYFDTRKQDFTKINIQFSRQNTQQNEDTATLKYSLHHTLILKSFFSLIRPIYPYRISLSSIGRTSLKTLYINYFVNKTHLSS